MNVKNENRPGYKKTKVGWIPEEWKCERFTDIFNRIAVPLEPEPQNIYQEIGLRSHGNGIFHKPLVNGTSIGDKRVFYCIPGTLVFNIVFAWEQAVAVISERERGLIASHRFPMYKGQWKQAYEPFFLLFFKTRRGKDGLVLASPGGAGRNKTLGQKDLKILYVPKPPLPEQKAIAEVLECWDEGIRKLELKIEKKRNIKKGLMQKLLSGEQRLPGFEKTHHEEHEENEEKRIPEGWKEVRLGEVGKIVCGGTPSTENSDYWEGDIPWITPSEIAKLYDKYIYTTERYITCKGMEESSANLLPCNSIIVCTRATVGDCAINSIPLSTNQGFKSIIVNDSNCTEFVYYKVLNMKKHFVRYASGSTFLEISKQDFEKLKMILPSLLEQQAIAAVLSSSDSEIEGLERKLALFKNQKKYLLNNLVTGTIRLPEFRKSLP